VRAEEAESGELAKQLLRLRVPRHPRQRVRRVVILKR
jgi:hypothetical protein